MAQVAISAEQRTEFGKGASRRLRRAFKTPAVLYGHGEAPYHLAMPTLELAKVIRENGLNAVLELQLPDGKKQLALTRDLVVHPIKNYFVHADLLLVRRGEKVSVNVPILVTGDAAPGTLVTQDLNELEVEADALNIPEQFEVSIDQAEEGLQIHASEVPLPRNVDLLTDPEALVVNVVAAPTEADMESEIDTEGAGVVEDTSEEDADTSAGAAPEAQSGNSGDES